MGKLALVALGFFVLYLSSVIAETHSQQMIFQEPLSPRIANYQISAQLDVKKREILGQEILTWRNDSSDWINELHFHLYMNAFKNTESTFMRESGGVHRGYGLKEKEWGYIDIISIKAVDGHDLTDSMEFIHPDDDNQYDQTVMRVRLPKALRPGGTIQLSIYFRTKLPKVFARTGYRGDFFMAGQWFPKIGVYINGQWNCHQFHRNSEFFADFGVYDVNITVPKRFVVGATGSFQAERDNGDGTKTLVYRAEDVHDFAWTADPNFKVIEEQFEHVKIILLCQSDHLKQAQRYIEAAQQTLKYFGECYGEYPYPTLTIVDPARGAGGAAGMEYPTLITAGTYWLMPKGLRFPEMVVIHELGHNYWYGLVASNEFEEAWLDEGINTYGEMKVLEALYGPEANAVDFCGIKVSDLEFQKAQYLAGPDLDPVYQKAWEFYNHRSYSINSYAKPCLILTTLENYLGRKVMAQIMRTYFQRWKFKHPTTQDFINVVNEVSGQDMNWYFHQVIYGSEILDYAVTKVSCRRERERKGIGFEKEEGEEEKAEIPDTLGKAGEAKEEEKIYESEVKIRRLGGVTFPVEVLIKFENGEEIREHWDGKSHWVRYRYRKPTKLVFAQVDPDEKVVLDVNFNNNSRTLKHQSKGVNKLALRWLFWVQSILHFFSFFS